MQYTTEELSAILSKHSKWLNDKKGGDRANLQDANLQGANLRDANLRDAYLQGANLQRANLDFSCLPLWCGGSKFTADAKLASLIAAHFCAIECDDPAYIAARAAVLSFALTSHRASDLGLKE